MKNPSSISIVVPVYNEEDNVLLLYRKIHDVCIGLGQSYEIVFVDDGSTDGTFALLAQIHKDDQAVRVVRFRKNYGQTSAMAAGFAQAQGEVIVSMDGDLQNDPDDVPRLLMKLDEGFDVVCGWRKRRQDKFLTRRLPSIAANWIIGKVTGVPIHDNGCSLKAYRASVIKNVSLYGEMHRFIPAMSTLAGARISEIVVNHHARRFGKSKYGVGRIWRVMLDIITVKMLIGSSSQPALWFGILSLPLFLMGGLLLAVAWGFNTPSDIEEWVVLSTIGFLLIFLGVQFIAIGAIGELSMKTGDYSPQTGLSGSTRLT